MNWLSSIPSSSGERTLEGVRIVDLTRYLPFTTLLADMGAEVIKVEEPRRGDYARTLPPYFSAVHRNKRSLTLNLNSPKGREVLLKLVERGDVLVENFRPGVMEKWGLDYDTLSGRNSRLVYCSISGYGKKGPYRLLSGHDINYLSLGGVLGLTRDENGKPVIPGVQIADMGTCLLTTVAILSALFHRERTGKGQYLEISFLGASLFFLTLPSSLHLEGWEVGEETLPLLGHFPCYAVYRTSDGKYLSIGCLEEVFWERLCEVLGKREYLGHQWDLEKREEIFEAFQRIFLTRKREEWFRLLSEADVPVAPVYSLEEVFSDPQVKETGMLVEEGGRRELGFPFQSSLFSYKPRRKAPSLGEHTEEILKELGYTEEEVEEMRAEGVV
ncbi:MAG: CaiB/BaiF CoA-transferase family protein [Candidatus Hadarchaeales archaeon]